MDFVITKASDDEWVECRHFDSVEDILKFKERQHHDIIITDNAAYLLSPDEVMDYWRDIDYDTIKRMSEIPYQIIIYDSYIE